MPEQRLIDVNNPELYNKSYVPIDYAGVEEYPLSVEWDDIKNAPAIDAVPVVRCSQCENWQRDWVCQRGNTGDHYCAVLDNVFSPDFYCKFGKTMNGKDIDAPTK